MCAKPEESGKLGPSKEERRHRRLARSSKEGRLMLARDKKHKKLINRNKIKLRATEFM